MKNDQEKKKWDEIVAKAWADETFKKELIANPSKVCKEHGIDLHGLECQVVEDTSKKFYFVIPRKPEGQLKEEDLRKIAGTSFTCCPMNDPTNTG